MLYATHQIKQNCIKALGVGACTVSLRFFILLYAWRQSSVEAMVSATSNLLNLLRALPHSLESIAQAVATSARSGHVVCLAARVPLLAVPEPCASFPSIPAKAFEDAKHPDRLRSVFGRRVWLLLRYCHLHAAAEAAVNPMICNLIGV